VDDYPSVKILNGEVDRPIQSLLENPVLGDQYLVDQAGAVGSNASAQGTTMFGGNASGGEES
jgi:hypothetical protein